jgi:hypothetical protein
MLGIDVWLTMQSGNLWWSSLCQWCWKRCSLGGSYYNAPEAHQHCSPFGNGKVYWTEYWTFTDYVSNYGACLGSTWAMHYQIYFGVELCGSFSGSKYSWICWLDWSNKEEENSCDVVSVLNIFKLIQIYYKLLSLELYCHLSWFIH